MIMIMIEYRLYNKLEGVHLCEICVILHRFNPLNPNKSLFKLIANETEMNFCLNMCILMGKIWNPCLFLQSIRFLRKMGFSVVLFLN